MPDHDGRNPVRPLYLAAELIRWVDETDELYVEDWSDRAGGRSRFEHLEQMLSDFRCDRRPLVGDLNRVKPTKRGIWSMHCPGLRVFGWVPDTWSIVAVAVAFAEDAHGPNSVVDAKINEVLDFAKANGLAGTIQLGERSGLFQQKT